MSTTLNAIEAPVTFKAYLMCAFASFGGIFFGYDSGYINGVLAAREFINAIAGEGADRVSGPNTSLIVSILSAGTFFGALAAGDLADMIGRRWTIIGGCVIYLAGVVIQMFAAEGLGVIVAGRVIAGVGVGFVSAIIILYMSEICPRKIRGSLVSGYQFCITIGIMLASIVNNFTQNRTDSGAYRIPIGIQFAWGLILGGGLLFLPDSPRYFVKKNNIPKARAALASVRGQPEDSHFVDAELAEIIANAEYERSLMPSSSWFGQWAACFSGSVFRSSSNLRRTILGATLQMMQQWTGVNFIFYYSTQFLSSTGAISDPFLITMIFTIVNVCSTPVSFYTVEKFGRRKLLVVGAAAMALCQFIVAIVGVTVGFNKLTTNAAGESVARNISAVNAQVAFIAIFIFFFASTWGPGAWVLIGEIFPLPIRSRGVALSTASNWLWNTIIAVITPYMTDADKGNLRSSVFFIWGGLCTMAFIWAYLFVPETKGLTLEQVDQMFAETTPRKSSHWVPSGTYVQGTTQNHITEVKSHDHKMENGQHIA